VLPRNLLERNEEKYNRYQEKKQFLDCNKTRLPPECVPAMQTCLLKVLTNIYQTCVRYFNIISIFIKEICYFLFVAIFMTEHIVVFTLFLLAIIIVADDDATSTTKLSVRLCPCDGAMGDLIEMPRHSLFVGLNNTTCAWDMFCCCLNM
jgi:hypothetical protein